MQSKSLLIAIAAFAVTATGVHAYGGTKLMTRAGLSEDQQSALEEARVLREEGDFSAARDVLVDAGINEETLRSLHGAMHESRQAMHDALEAGDYDAFKEAIEGTPLADIITSESDFELFQEAHELKDEGDFDGAKAIFDTLGIEAPLHHHGFKGGHMRGFSELSDEQREALNVARQANDRETIKAILEEAGVGPKFDNR